jgi:cellulose synthase/poly-beta-1,6-N-acetylglucosamine synthase-like glycosyltransferase
VPLVDVIIPCCNESLDVLQDTILAAIALDYPEDRFRVIVTDDGGSAHLRAWVAEQGQHNLYYTARVKNGSSGFKAGNLNHAIQFIETQLAPEPAEFIASLDADMIPEKKWLRAMTPHLVLNPKIGVVCPTQVSGTRVRFYHFLSCSR